MVRDVVIVGAGIAGLSCAWRLRRAGLDVEVLEAGPRPGGAVATIREDGWVVDTGPQTVMARDPQLLRHFHELGIEHRRVVAGEAGRDRFVMVDGVLVALPRSPRDAVKTSLLSLRGKLRLLAEPLAGGGPENETVASFFARRMGPEVADRIVDPFVSGIYAGDPHAMEIAATFPSLAAGVAEHGSLLRMGLARALKARGDRKQGRPRPQSELFSFDGGLSTWTDTLADAIGRARVRTGTSARRVRRNRGAWHVLAGDEGEETRAEVVVLAVPAPVVASILADVSSQGAAELAAVKTASVATVALGYEARDVTNDLRGFGVLMPSREGRSVLGILWISSLFRGRAPDGRILTTTFIGGSRHPARASLPDRDLIDLAHGEHQELLGARGKPVFSRVTRWSDAIPQPEAALTRARQVAAEITARPEGLFLCGNYQTGGPAVPACWRRGQDVAEAIIAGIPARAFADATAAD